MATTTRAQRRISHAQAHAAKAGGAGSSATAPREMVSRGILSRIGSAAVGFVTGGVPGAIAGAVTDPLGKGGGAGTPSRPAPPTSSTYNMPGASALAARGPCPSGHIQVSGRCINPLALPPGGKPAVVPSSGTDVSGYMAGRAVMGGFGLPAMEPRVETRIHRECGPGMVLGKDDLCYPKAILSRRSRFRKWRQPPRPPVTSADVKAIRRAARARDRVSDLAQDVGFKKPKRK